MGKLKGTIALGMLAAAMFAWLGQERTVGIEQPIPSVRGDHPAQPAEIAPLAKVTAGGITASAAPPAPDAVLHELLTEAARLQALARYPRWSQPLQLIGDPLAESAVMQVQSSGPEGADLVLTAYTDRRTFDAPEPVLIHAHLMTAQGLVPANMRAIVSDAAGQPVTELHLLQDGQAYVASFTPSATAGANTGYSIRVQASTGIDERREVTLDIMYNQPYAHLTGNFRDRFENGDLVIEAEVSVQRGAAFRVTGSLYGADEQQQIAFAEATQQLSPGSGWVPLRFHGLILREQRVNGPYLLRYASLTTQTQDAEATMHALQNAYTTGSYTADAFDGEDQQDPQWLAEAARLRTRATELRQELQQSPGASAR